MVQQNGDQLAVQIPRRSLEVDFLVTDSETERVTGGSPSPELQFTGQSAVLHWTRRGDSLALMVYHGWAHRQIQYARYGAYAILHTDGDSVFRIGAGNLFGLVVGERSFIDSLRHAEDPQPLRWTVQAVTTAGAPGRTQVQLTTLGHGLREHLVKSTWTFEPLPVRTAPMFPRLPDSRLGYAEPTPTQGSGGEVAYAPRWRLEKRDPAAAVSEVVHPIVYRIDSTVPRKWVPWITRGVEAWGVALESVGFRHAIVVRVGARRAKTADGDDAPECQITWPGDDDGSGRFGAYTNTETVDRRTGEILHCTMYLGDGTLHWGQRVAFLYAGATDPHLRYPFADSVSGRLLQWIVEHEMGHTLGFGHNQKAGSAYPTDSLRSAGFVHRMGITPSVMSYVHFDAVAQPEDSIPPADLIMHIGPYDLFALGWLYRPIPAARTPEEERPTLERWRAVQDTVSYLHTSALAFAGGIDPGDRTGGDWKYVLGNDQVKSAQNILRNLARLAPVIDAQHDAVHPPTGASSLPAVLRAEVLGFRERAMASAIDVLGGGIPQNPYAQPVAKTRVVPIDSVRQVQALHFVIDDIFYGNDALVQTVFGRQAADTTLLLFDTAPPPWTTEQWQATQRTLADRLVDRAKQVAAQAPTTHVLPVWCASFDSVREALRKVADGTAQRAAREQAEKLRTLVQPLFVPGEGVCRRVDPTGAAHP